jgi:hypothetical protein
MTLVKSTGNTNEYICKCCLYKCNKQSDYNKHINTRKHKRRVNDANGIPEVAISHICICGKSYKHKTSLYKHYKSCKITKQKTIDSQDTVENQDKNKDKESLILALITQNKELMNLLQEQTKTIQEMIPKIGGINIQEKQHLKK